MSLVICTVCGRSVSTEAAACPGCGQPGPTMVVPPRRSVYLEGIDGPVRRGGSGPFVAVAAVLLLGGATMGVMRGNAGHEVHFTEPAAVYEVVEAPLATFELSEVDAAPELANSREVAGALSRLYPPLLRDAGVTGQVTLRFRVTPEGVVDPGSVSVENATSDHFAGPAQEVLGEMHFNPAKVQGEPVAVWVTMPFAFMLEQ